ncbi:MAG: TonB-dependent receptor [Deltaproteobacteria bacterium]|nr:TonB-dependent receptor [Deltaproteobacteria bacterium]
MTCVSSLARLLAVLLLMETVARAQAAGDGAAPPPVDFNYEMPVEVAAPAETVVVEGEAIDVARPGTHSVSLHARQGNLQDQLDALPGVRMVRTGGDGSAFNLSIRGLQGRRVATYLGPIRLDDPVTGVLDLGEVPAAALENAELTPGATAASEGALGGMLRLKPGVPLAPVLTGSFTYGSEKLFGVDVAAGRPVTLGKLVAGALVLARGITTNGKFDYEPVVGPLDAPIVLPARARVNNDRHRAGLTLLAAGEWIGGPSGEAVLDVSLLKGGIAGFGTQQLPTPRETQVRTAAGFQLRTPAWHGLEPRVETAVRHASWKFEDPRPGATVKGALESVSHNGRATLVWAVFPMLAADASASWVLDAAWSHGDSGAYRTARPSAGVDAGLRFAPLSSRVVVEARVRGQGWLVQQGAVPVPVYPRGVFLPELRASVRPFRSLVLHAQLTRAWRNPSLEELYRPVNVPMAGNPGLRAEDGWEAGGGAALALPFAEVGLSAYGARMAHMIAYTAVNAFDVRPQNVSGVWRAGGELWLRAQLGRWGEVAAGTDVNGSRVDATGAALPAVPLLEAHASARLGPPRARLVLEWSGRSGASGNLYGELPIRPATRFNGGVEIGLFPGVEVRAMVRNLFNDRTQTDLWGVPQPGREGFVNVGVTPGDALGGRG